MSSLLSERRIVAILLLALTAGLVVSTFGLQFADLGGAFSPMFFPRIVLTVLLGLTALNLAVDLMAREADRPVELMPVLVVGAAFLAYVLLIVPLGYFIASVGVGVVILLALGLRDPLVVLAVPVVGAGALVGLFNHVLTMPLPTSPFFWWI